MQPKDAKELARHSTITLTMDRYAHVGLQDTTTAIAKLPGLAAGGGGSGAAAGDGGGGSLTAGEGRHGSRGTDTRSKEGSEGPLNSQGVQGRLRGGDWG